MALRGVVRGRRAALAAAWEETGKANPFLFLPLKPRLTSANFKCAAPLWGLYIVHNIRYDAEIVTARRAGGYYSSFANPQRAPGWRDTCPGTRLRRLTRS